MLIKQAQRVMDKSRKLLEQRELQLRQLEHVLQFAAHGEIVDARRSAKKGLTILSAQ
jgi:hypothetical protein